MIIMELQHNSKILLATGSRMAVSSMKPSTEHRLSSSKRQPLVYTNVILQNCRLSHFVQAITFCVTAGRLC